MAKRKHEKPPEDGRPLDWLEAAGEPDEDAKERFDRTLRRLVETPPKPRKAKKPRNKAK